MSELKEKIFKDFTTAFKERNVLKKDVLSFVKADITNFEKSKNFNGTLTDNDVVNILNKLQSQLIEMIESGDVKRKEQLEIIETYLPTKMSESEIISKINNVISLEGKNMGKIMASFKNDYVDRALVSKIAKELMEK